MKYILFITTNTKSKINGINRILADVHAVEDPSEFDNYLGDGVYTNQPASYMYPKTAFQCAVKKYGTTSFVRSVLCVYDTKEEAYAGLGNIITAKFIEQSFTYNTRLDNISSLASVLYQFNEYGKVVRRWDNMREACDFYSMSINKMAIAINDHRYFHNSFWSFNKSIDKKDYKKEKTYMQTIYLYNMDGKLLYEFANKQVCADALGLNEKGIITYINSQIIVNDEFYLSNKLTDEFKVKPRRQYNKATFYVYDKNNNLIGTAKGKKVMPIIKNFSWRTIQKIMQEQNGNYLDMHITVDPLVSENKRSENKIPEIEIYDKYGNYIETSTDFSQIQKDYGISKCELKHLEWGNKYFKNFIFKYKKNK